MTWRESKCICGKDTSGMLPFTLFIHRRGELFGEIQPDRCVMTQYYPCDECWPFFKKLWEYEIRETKEMRAWLRKMNFEEILNLTREYHLSFSSIYIL